MPKKSKALKSDESVTSAHTSEENGQYSGVFKHDLPIACVEHGIPNIPVLTLDGTGAEDQQQSVGGPQCVWVKNDLTKDPSGKRLHSLSIRGWLVTGAALHALTTALKSSSVGTLQFWNTGLDTSTLPLLADLALAVQCSCIVVDGIILSDLTGLIPLLTTSANLRVLQLRSCALVDEVVQPLLNALATNTTLQQLDLSHNALSDTACTHLGDMLRVNRSLVSLTLSNNKITDVGVARIVSVLHEFPLTHEEIVKRRRALSQCHEAEWSKVVSQRTSRRSSSKLSRSKATDRDKSKKGDVSKRETAARVIMASASFIAKAKRSADSARKKAKEKQQVEEQTQESRPSSVGLVPVTGPLLDGVVEKNGKVFAPGNKVLINLGLSYNQVGVAGCDMLLAVVLSQREEVRAESSESAPHTTGLKRISLHHNLFPSDLKQYQQLLALLPPLTTDVAPPPSPATITSNSTSNNLTLQ